MTYTSRVKWPPICRACSGENVIDILTPSMHISHILHDAMPVVGSLLGQRRVGLPDSVNRKTTIQLYYSVRKLKPHLSVNDCLNHHYIYYKYSSLFIYYFKSKILIENEIFGKIF